MSRLLRSTILMAAAVATALACYVGATLPPRTVVLDGAPPRETVFGAYHIHTDRSDGSGTPDDVAAAAARSALSFILLTDHGDGTRAPDAPAYRHGVLCVDGAEINTLAGHLVALGLTSAAPYPLAGEAGDVIEDVHRLGGWTVVAHPDSPTPALRWRNWTVPYDGVEWLNADSEWRDRTASTLAGTALRAIVRSPESIATLFRRPARTLQRWDDVIQYRPVVALAALDAHARLPWPGAPDPRPRTLLARPSYESMFRTLSQAVMLDAPFSGDAAADARHL
ncbi:MAG: PHP domain-containing protein, partial [Vicinamibacterales bacterium]